MMLRKIFFLLFTLPFVAMAGDVTVTSVTAQQRYPWNGKVDIVVTMQGDTNEIAETECVFLATNIETQVALPVSPIDLVSDRWSFNGDLTDSVGGQTATAVGSSVSSSSTQYTLSGSSNGAGYISLGSNILPKDGSPVTIELWATHNAYRSYSRMVTFMETIKNSPINGGSDEFSLCWDGDADAICRLASWHFAGVLLQYTYGVEYHVSAVFTPLSTGGWKVDFYKKSVSNGATLAHYVKTFTSSEWTLQIQPQTYCMLGHVNGDAGAYDANASYNEFRVWKKAMTEAELTASAKAGPDADL